MRLDVALELGGDVVDDRGRAAHDGGRERRALPEVVVVGLRNRRAEAALELSLERDDLLPLALQACVVGQVELDLDQADDAYSSSLSTWRVSKTSRTSPSFTS